MSTKLCSYVVDLDFQDAFYVVIEQILFYESFITKIFKPRSIPRI